MGKSTLKLSSISFATLRPTLPPRSVFCSAYLGTAYHYFQRYKSLTTATFMRCNRWEKIREGAREIAKHLRKLVGRSKVCCLNRISPMLMPTYTLCMCSVGWCRAIHRITDVRAHTETYYRPQVCAPRAYDVETELHLTRVILICHSIMHHRSLSGLQSSPPPHCAFYGSANSDENCASATGETINGSRGSCLLKQLAISPV